MSSKIEDIDDILNDFNYWKDGEKEEIIELKNPVLNAMLHGGLPKKGVVQIAAQSGVGKSTLVLQMSKELLEQGYNVLYIDAEGGLNENQMKSTGVFTYLNNKNKSLGGNFKVAWENDCGKINDLIQKVGDNELVDFIMLDSLGALDSGIYQVGGTDANNPKVGADTKSVKIILKTMTGLKMKHKIGFVFINHLAQSIGTYIPTDNPTGGRAPLFFSDVIIKLTKAGDLVIDDQKVGQKVNYEIMKSRRGLGKCKIPFYVRFGQGIAMIPTYAEVLDKVTVSFQGEKRPLLEMRGGGNGSLFVNDTEFKFRGEKQLQKLIVQNYNYIKSIISWKMFAPSEVNLSDWDNLDNNSTSQSTIPEEFSKLKVVDSSVDKIYFDKGIDSTGQEYGIYYGLDTERLVIDFDSSTEEINEPILDDYKQLKKKLQKYLKSL